MATKLVTDLVERFAKSSSEPFEEFASEIAGLSMAYMATAEDKNEFARRVFSCDWSEYTNERGERVVSMKEILEAGIKSEKDHIEFIRTRTDFKDHDHSKDDFFVLICALRFRCPNFNVTTYAWFVQFCDVAVFRPHYKTEPHHPEYERYVPDGECSLKDVEETAIDRAARNFQFSADGRGDATTMVKFTPTWIKNSERNAQHYLATLISNYTKIGEMWRDFIATTA
jgi:hypothetical protein